MPTAVANAGSLAPKKLYRSARQIEREANILAKAREELTDRGYEGVTMDVLAEKAGVVKKTLYNLYGSKDELLLAAISEIVDNYRGVRDQAEAGIPSIIASRIGATQQVVATPAYAEAMTRAVAQAPADHSLVTLLLRDSVEFQRAHLAVAEANGELRAGTDTTAIAEQIVSQGWGTTVMCMKRVIPLDRFESQSRSGLLLILTSITTGPRRTALARELEHTTRGESQ